MSWADYYERRDAIDLVLEHAARHRDAGLPFAELDSVRSVFTDREELALALQYKWSQALMGRVTVALVDAEKTPDVDHVEAVAAAWRTTARQQQTLREVLDAYAADPDASQEFLAALRAEQRMVAFAAGLAEVGESDAEAARIGAAFMALVRGTPRQRTARHRTPIEQLLRRLVASA
jgi:hypothetical protein